MRFSLDLTSNIVFLALSLRPRFVQNVGFVKFVALISLICYSFVKVDKLISLIYYMGLSKVIYGFFYVVSWIFQIDKWISLLLLHGFVKVATWIC